MLCEYFIQNDQELSDPYVNMYILPKKYADISDVQVKDVVSSFPLNMTDKDQSYVLRFQHSMQLSSSKMKLVWLDVGRNLNVCVPNVDGKIRIKALRLPKGIRSR